MENDRMFARIVVVPLLSLLVQMSALAQCTNNNNPIAGGAITPPCPGSMLVPCVNGGQYALVNVTNGNIYEFNTCNATYDTRITLYNNAGGGSIGFNDDACGVQSSVVWTANYTGQLRVLVDRYISFFNTCNHSGGCAPLSITCYQPPPPVSNNECANAIDLFVFPGCFTQSFSNVGATNSTTTPNPTCGYNGTARDVWFRFTVPASGVVIIRSTAFTLTDAAMQVYSGTCGALSLVECDDDDGPGLMPMIDRRCLQLNPGQTYYLRFWGYNGSSGTFGLCVDGPDFFPTPQQDCSGGFTVCNSGGVNNTSDFTGCTQDLNSGNSDCLVSYERQGTWYYFSPQSAGTIAFNVLPVNALGNPAPVDYDFAVWGPYNTVSCPPANAPIRCSYALPATNGPWNTGLGAGDVDLSEGASGNGFVAPITVGAAQVGQVYLMYLDNFSTNGQAFNLAWNLSSSGMLDCTLLPVRLLSFTGEPSGTYVQLKWVTQAMGETERFKVEHSSNGTDFTTIGILEEGSGSNSTNYDLLHKDPLNGSNYYRLVQIDHDGSQHTSDVIHVVMRSGQHMLIPRPNPASSMVYLDLPATNAYAYQVNLMDASGRVVRAHAGQVLDASTQIAVPLDGIEVGCYVIQILDNMGNTLGTGRFVRE